MPTLVLTPTTVTDDAGFGSVAWTNPGGFRVRNFGEATATLQPGDTTHYARAAFDCSALPAGVTLTGIGVEAGAFYKLTDVGQPGDAAVRLSPGGGSPAGDDKARPADLWHTTYSPTRVYGGDGDLWAAGLDADAVRAGGLDVLFAAKWQKNPNAGAVPDGAAKARGDTITLTLYYS